jgi:hypothetical protein
MLGEETAELSLPSLQRARVVFGEYSLGGPRENPVGHLQGDATEDSCWPSVESTEQPLGTGRVALTQLSHGILNGERKRSACVVFRLAGIVIRPDHISKHLAEERHRRIAQAGDRGSQTLESLAEIPLVKHEAFREPSASSFGVGAIRLDEGPQDAECANVLIRANK